MRDLIILPSWLVVNPSPEPEVTEPFWSEWFSDEERSDEVTLPRGVDCQCAICLGGSN